MPYRVRAFCIGLEVPALRDVFEYAKSQGVELSGDESHGPVNVDSTEWTEAEIAYKEGKSPLVLECDRDDGTDDGPVREECGEFIDEIGRCGLSFAKRRVVKHLNETRFIIVSQLLNDIDEDGYNANSTFLEYFVKNCGGMIHADLEGFYDGNKVIVKVG